MFTSNRMPWVTGFFVQNGNTQACSSKETPLCSFCDNLEGQKNPDFKDAASSCGSIVWYGLANATDIWEPVGVWHIQLLNAKIKQEFFN